MIIINNIDELQKFKLRLKKITKDNVNYNFSYDNFQSAFYSFNDIHMFIDEKQKLLALIKKREETIYESFIENEPIYNINQVKDYEIIQFIEEIYRYLNCKVLYFPLIYEDSNFFCKLSEVDKFIKYKRLYTSICETNLLGDENYTKIKRYFKYYNKKKCEMDFELKTVSKCDIKDVITPIEINSWKHSFGQDLCTKDEYLSYYNYLVIFGIASITYLISRLDRQPIAYRIDIPAENYIQLKTSFNENYKKYKPGTYLLLYDLIIPNRHIDLFGGPNTIKDAIETNKINRYDFCYGVYDDCNLLKLKRKKWDEKNYSAFINSKALRSVYEKNI